MARLEGTTTTRPPSLVPRTVLFERLATGYAAGVTLVSAPPGSGKTVLLRSWIDAAGLGERTAWITVERDERDAQRFWLSVVEALSAAAGAQGPIDVLEPSPRFDGEAVVDRILVSLESLEQPVLLVVDDLHELLEPSALGQLELLLARRPPPLRVILSTRHDPAIGLHRLRLAGELTELRAGDLRFQRDEAVDLLSGANVTLSDAAIASLLARTEGWVAGLRLAALSLAGHLDPEGFIAEFSGSERTIADYLFAEVLARQPEPVRRLLLRTSILDRVNGSLADRLLETTGSERSLLDLEDAGAFVFSIDRQRTWFRYHSLFADLLRLELRRAEPAVIPRLHHVAAEWYAEHQMPIEAIRHAQRAEDWSLAAELLAQHGFSIALDGTYATIRGLLEQFPKDSFANPELAAFVAYGEVIRPSLDTGASYIALAERHAAEVPAERRRLFGAMLATARLTLARWRGDYATALVEARPLLEPAEAETVGQVTVGSDAKAVALMSLGIVELWAGAGDDAEHHLAEAADLARRMSRPYVEQGSLAHLALAVSRHSIIEARDLAMQALRILERYGWSSEPVVPMVLATLGGLDALQGRFTEAEEWLGRAEAALRPNAEPAKELLIRYARGTQRLGQGRLADANALFEETQRLQTFLVDPDPLAIAARGFQVQTLARLGRGSAARAALATATDGEQEFAETRTALAATLLLERDPRGAIDALAPVLAGTARLILPYMLPNALIVDALARDAVGEATRAVDDVEQALDRAETDALVLPFLVTPARELLERHPRHRTAHAALLSSILDVLAGASIPARNRDPLEPAEELTESELRVLRYLPSNLSAPEIATDVVLSTSTVKTHMRHIYEKLGVHKRTEAVDRARQLGLLGPSVRRRR
jgi:LuxR family maltose regulon positive regulatory protein